jgi:hypothetical protein
MFFDKSKLIILVCGTNNSPHDANWKECERTWVPELKSMGYKVMTSFGLPSLNNYYLIDGDRIYFKTSDEKFGLVDKRIKLPIRWILNETNYQYYFNIDSDSFVNPYRFDKMIEDNFSKYATIDYMGCSIPVDFWAYQNPMRYLTQENGVYAIGGAWFLSKKGMVAASERVVVTRNAEFEFDDLVLGRAMYESNIPLLHDGRILLHSKYRAIFPYPEEHIPDITDDNSYLAIQHYMSGHMDMAMAKLKKQNKNELD